MALFDEIFICGTKIRVELKSFSKVLFGLGGLSQDCFDGATAGIGLSRIGVVLC